MKLVKLFETSDMPKYLFDFIRESNFVRDGSSGYVVGLYLNENISQKEDCPSPMSDEDIQIFKKSAELYTKCDDWFKERGAEHMEHILIHHGDFNLKPDYLF